MPDTDKDIPVTRAELEAEAVRVIERDGMPDEGTDLAGLVLGYFAEVDQRHRPITRRPGWGQTCFYDNHRWPCADANPEPTP